MEGWFNALSCREASRRVAAGLLDDGSGLECLRLRFHLLICAQCRRFVRQMRCLGQAARAWAATLLSGEKQAELERRLLERLR